MNILITGGAGGIGSTLAYRLHTFGHTVHIVDNLSNGYMENIDRGGTDWRTFHNMDIRDTDALEYILKLKGIEYVIHLAAITSLPECEINPQECISVNVGGTASVLNAIRNNAVKRMVFSSTSAVYENNSETPFTEDMTVADLIMSHRNNYGMNCVILRYFNVFGPRQDIHRKSPPLINYLVREFMNDRAPILHSDGNQQRDYVHIDDVCLATDLAMDNPAMNGNIYNVCTGTTLSVREIVNIVKSTLGSEIEPIYRDADKFWDTYPSLFYGKYSLARSRMEKETNKYSVGSSEQIQKVIGSEPDKNMHKLISQVANKIKEVYYK